MSCFRHLTARAISGSVIYCAVGQSQVLSGITGQLPISGDAICYSARGAISGKVICYCLYDLFLGVSVITVQCYELFLVIVSCILVQYQLFLGALQCKS